MTPHNAIEGPQDREQRIFGAAEAAAFMRSWYRVVNPDGSTVAYCPDRVTAESVARALIDAEREET